MTIPPTDLGGLTATDLGMPPFADALGRALGRISMVMAIVGVLIICGLAGMLCITIVARKLLGWQVTGDHEIVQILAAVSVSMLFPWCHLTGGNVIVDLLTSGLPRRANRALDRIGSLLLGLMALVLAWRTGLLVEQTIARGTFTPLLALPVWIPQAMMIPGLLLTAVVGVYLALSPRAIDTRDASAGVQ
jgi:TRAP-type C4-dicarboxylate transport system permease small subunit